MFIEGLAEVDADACYRAMDVILEPSRFLTELPDGVFERWTIERESTPEEAEAHAADEPVN